MGIMASNRQEQIASIEHYASDLVETMDLGDVLTIAQEAIAQGLKELDFEVVNQEMLEFYRSNFN